MLSYVQRSLCPADREDGFRVTVGRFSDGKRLERRVSRPIHAFADLLTNTYETFALFVVLWGPVLHLTELLRNTNGMFDMDVCGTVPV